MSPRRCPRRSATVTRLLLGAAALAGLAAPWPGVPRLGDAVAAGTGRTPVGPRGVYYGWASPADARVWLEAAPCDRDDPPARVVLESGQALAALLGLAPPPLAFALDGSAVLSLPGAQDQASALDVGAGFVAASAGPDRPGSADGGRGSSDADGGPGAAARGPRREAFARARVTCRSWREAAWALGRLEVEQVDGPAGDDRPLAVVLVPEPAHTGVYAVLLLWTWDEPVTLRSVGYAPASAATGKVVAGVGSADSWPEWRAAIRGWSEAGARGAVDPGRPAVRPYWRADGPAPPLFVRDAASLDLALGPYSTALIALGAWSFRRPLEYLLAFPTVTYEHAGALRRVGLTEPLRLVKRQEPGVR